MLTTHQTFMQQALALAALGRYTVSPNPMVGCVLVNEGQLVGQGFHQQAGDHHAEVLALNDAGHRAKGAIAYITLEPCCHQGKTPPCTEALIKAGIKKVYVACLDPNPLVSGKGIAALQKAGIEVEVGLCTDAAKELNASFFHYITSKRPYVIAKWAMSLDGKTVTHENDDRQISGDESQQTTHELRQQVDAILIGSQTALKDDPLLTVRYAKDIIKQPLRIILLSGKSLPLNLKLFDTSTLAKTMVAATDNIDTSFLRALEHKNIEVLVLNKNQHDRVSIPHLLDTLGKKQITSLLVEGGMTLHEDFFRENCVNQTHVFIAPFIIGAQDNKLAFNNIKMMPSGRDLHITTNEDGA